MLITDRTTIDNFVYLELYGHREKIINKRLMKMIEENNQSYDIIVYVPIRMCVSSDGFRDVNELFRLMIDEEIKERLKDIERSCHNVVVLEKDKENNTDIFERVLKVINSRENF